MKKLFLILLIASVSSCGTSYKLNKACNITAAVQSVGGGRVAVCVVCDSITPRLLKKLTKRYGTSQNLEYYARPIN